MIFSKYMLLLFFISINFLHAERLAEGSTLHTPAALSTTPVHVVSNREPYLKLVAEENGKVYRYVDIAPRWLKVLLLVFMGIMLLSFMIKGKKRGVVVSLLAIGLIYFMFHKAEEERSVFDLNRQLFYKGTSLQKAKASDKKYARLDEIKALQILKDRACDIDPDLHFVERKCYDTYELNLVLNDNSRINIACHGDYAQIRDDATRLSKVLGKPVLDGVK